MWNGSSCGSTETISSKIKSMAISLKGQSQRNCDKGYVIETITEIP